jgi:transcription antitermination factor NusG
VRRPTIKGGFAVSGSRSQKVAAARARLAQRYAADPDQVKRFQARMSRLSAVRRREDEPDEEPKRWCILRCAARDTITLTDKLEKAGFDVWTPIEITTRRVTRTRERVEHLAAVMPSFVFAEAARAGDLFRLSSDQSKEIPDFSVFHMRDRVPYIKDRDIAELRKFEAKCAETHEKMMGRSKLARKPRGAPLAPGDEVRIPSGPFAGMTGIVESSGDRFTIVFFGKPVSIETFLLRSDVIEEAPSVLGHAA